MTAPVTQSVEIDMTVPVTQKFQDDNTVMQFFLPSKFVYNSFLYITLGCFGIAGVEKVMTGKKDA